MPPTVHRPLLQGDEGDLYARHADHLRRVVARRVTTTTPDTVDDACQKAWAILLRAQPRRETVFPWLVVVACREAIRLEAENRRRCPLGHDGDLPDGWLAVPDPAEDPSREAVREALTAVKELPERAQRVQLLHAAGLSYQEIAEHTNTTRRSVERHLMRAHKGLRSHALARRERLALR